MRGTWRLRRWVRQVAPKAVILLYHRVAEVPTDPQLLCVTPQHFAQHLEVLRRNYHPLRLRSLQRRLALNLWPPRSVVITFDDGYADNLHQTRPLLEAADVPATVFVVAGKVGSEQEYWWDDLERILLAPPELPDKLTLAINGREYCRDLSQEDGAKVSDGRWHVLMKARPTPRQAVYLELGGLLQGMTGDNRETLLSELCAWAGVERTGRPGYRALTDDELRALARNGLVEIGAHTMTHPSLSALSPELQWSEIAGSKRRLEEILGQRVGSFSYPFGGRGDYTSDTVRLVADAGFKCACSNFPGLITWESDPYQLPRYLVRNWDGEEFARRLEGWFAE